MECGHKWETGGVWVGKAEQKISHECHRVGPHEHHMCGTCGQLLDTEAVIPTYGP